MKDTQVRPKISEVLHLAADKYLSVDGRPHNGDYMYGERFSCCAVSRAVSSFNLPFLIEQDFENDIYAGLKAMGCDTDGTDLFKKYGDDHDKGNLTVQGMRYFWLKWAALMAEEQGQ